MQGAYVGVRTVRTADKAKKQGAHGWDVFEAGFLGGLEAYGKTQLLQGWGQSITHRGGVVSGTASFAAHQYVNSEIREEVAAYAHRHGMSLSQLNLRLFGFSLLGNGITESRFTDKGWDTTKYGIRGYGNRGTLGLPFDVVDTVLAYQGLPTASSMHYLTSDARGKPLSGHSLGALDVANLTSLGFVQEAHLFALPFGKVGAGANVRIGSGDAINGFALGSLLNWHATLQSAPKGDDSKFWHGCRYYEYCGT